MGPMKFTRIKKGTALFMILLAGAFLIMACGKKEESAGKDISMEELEEKLLAADSTLPEMAVARGSDQDAEVTFAYLCGFDYDRVEDFFYAYADQGTAHEISVIRLKDPMDAALVMKGLKAHVESRLGTMENYSPDQVSMVEDHILLREGPYVALIICQKAGSVRSAFESFF